MKKELELLKEANEIIKSFNSVIERRGEETNWDALEQRVKEILIKQKVFFKLTKCLPLVNIIIIIFAL
jgi:alpha-mannosidase